MVPVIRMSVAWYVIPKAMEYLTTDCGTNTQSKIDHIRTNLFHCKGILEDLAYANAHTKPIYKAVQIHYPYMWLAVLTTSVFFTLFKPPFVNIVLKGYFQIIFCLYFHILSKNFVKSDRGIEWMTSLWGLTILNVGGLGFIESALSESKNVVIKQMTAVLKLRLKPSDTYEFLRGKSKKDLLSIIERVKCYKSAEEVHSLSNLIQDKFSEAEENWLESLPLQVREKLVKASRCNRSILDRLTDKSSSGDPYREWHNSIYARAIVELKINPQQYELQEVEKVKRICPIPSAFHDDLILRRYICPITRKPMRYPVEDPTTRAYQQGQEGPISYERDAIRNILESNPISPITQEPLTVDQLIPNRVMQIMIETRLQDYMSNIWRYLDTF